MPNISKSFYLDLKNVIWREGSLSHEEGLGRAARFGDGVFETCLVFNGRLLAIDLHAKRMQHGFSVLGFQPLDLNLPDVLDAALSEAARFFPGITCRLRIQASRTGQGAYMPTTDHAQFDLEITPMTGFEWQNPAGVQGLQLGCHPSIRTFPGPLSSVKSCSALPYVLAARHARHQGKDDCLLFATDGSISEASSSNFFIRHAATLITPPLSSGCLPGTMRERVLKIANKLGIAVQEKPIFPSELEFAEEAFLTNAIQGIRPILSVEGVHFDLGERLFSQKIWEKRELLT